MPASRAIPAAAAMTKAADTSTASPWPRSDAGRSRNAGQGRSRQCLLDATAGDVEKHFFQGRTVVARHDAAGAVIVLDAAALHDDDAVAQPLHFKHVV